MRITWRLLSVDVHLSLAAKENENSHAKTLTNNYANDIAVLARMACAHSCSSSVPALCRSTREHAGQVNFGKLTFAAARTRKTRQAVILSSTQSPDPFMRTLSARIALIITASSMRLSFSACLRQLLQMVKGHKT